VLPRSWLVGEETRKKVGRGGLSVEKLTFWSWTGEDLESTEASIPPEELKLEMESGCVLFNYVGKERASRGIRRSGTSQKKIWKQAQWKKIRNPHWAHSRTNQPPDHCSAPRRPVSASSVRLKHETKTKHSVTRGHTVETPTNGHAKNRHEASQGQTRKEIIPLTKSFVA